MPEAHRCRVQAQDFGARLVVGSGTDPRAVFRVADDRVARGGQVRAHLVGPAGVEPDTRSIWRVMESSRS